MLNYHEFTDLYFKNQKHLVDKKSLVQLTKLDKQRQAAPISAIFFKQIDLE